VSSVFSPAFSPYSLKLSTSLKLDPTESLLKADGGKFLYLCYSTAFSLHTSSSLIFLFEIPLWTKEDQSWVFIGRIDAKAETPILWPPHVKSWLIGKDPDAGKDWRREEKGTSEDEMVGWHHRLDGHEFEQTLGVGDGQESLACCSPWGHKELDTTEQLNWFFCRAGK